MNISGETAVKMGFGGSHFEGSWQNQWEERVDFGQRESGVKPKRKYL